jgi:hypothetical protein
MLIATAFATTAVVAVAQAPTPPTQGGRFAMHPADGGVIRLDTETGAMSMCKAGANGQWQCESLPDERTALNKEITRLERENKDLQGAVKRLEEMAGLPPERRAERAPDRPPFGKVPLPSEDDVDRAMTYLHGMLKKFKDKLKEFEDLHGNRTERL